MLLVTGASDNHVRSLRQFIASFVRHNTAGRHRLLVWNLGLRESDWTSIQATHSAHPYIGYEVFDYSKYPDWFDIAIDAGQYAWKPAILKLVATRHPAELVVWMDAGNVLTDSLRNLERFLRSNALYSSYSVGRIQDWTHPATVAALSPWGSLNAPKLNRNGACLGFNLTEERARLCLEEWATACANKEVIAPAGSSRANHRQDQSVFSILYYKYVGSDAVSNVFLGYTIHNDVDCRSV
jgi:hypothetical protein